MSVETMFGYTILAADLPRARVLLEETFAYTYNATKRNDFPPLEVPVRLFKDPLPL